jgi:2-oxoglutarate dehydrogenase E2 component (dihydrolipoamide succinyltransferase)
MPTNVVMPQMGESVAEGTVVRWIKKVGDHVDRDEPLFEISTDKVDAEIPSPVAGILTEIHVKEGETVPVDSLVAVIGAPGEAATREGQEPRTSTAVPAPDGDGRPASVPEDAPGERNAAAPSQDAPATAATPGGGRAAATAPPATQQPSGEALRDHLRRTRSSPLVRRIAQEHHVDITAIPGSGVGGRVTKQDILAHLERGPTAQAAPSATGSAAAGAAPAEPSPAAPPAATGHVPTFRPGERVEVVPMSVMRRKIAEHMVTSRRTSAHVHSVFEVDFHRVSQIRERTRAEYERAGAKLTFMSFIARAVCDALRAVPVVNASIDGDNIVYRQDINLGIAVALDWGLIVPVVRNADEKNLLGLSRAIADVAARARSKRLEPEEVRGGTFTITNPGVFGTLFGMPIINQPQVAILGVGAVEKRVVVIDDAIHVRPRAYLTLGYDHRLVDGAVADEFMSHVKRSIETFDPASA